MSKCTHINSKSNQGTIQMKTILAILFHYLFKDAFFKKKYYGLHKRLFKPFHLFKGVTRLTTWKGLTLYLHIDDWIQQHMYFLGGYEEAELKAVEQFLTADSVFIDIGANIGLYTLFAANAINENGQVISFEPFTPNFNSLTKNVSLNNFSTICLEKMAIGAKDGLINLYYDEKEKNLGMASSITLEKGVQEEVKLTALDSYLETKSLAKIDLIKIDIEGFEYAALLGMRNTLTKFRPTLLIEILKSTKSANHKSNCEQLLTSLGYHKYYIDDAGRLSKNEVNTNRMNYVYSTKIVANSL